MSNLYNIKNFTDEQLFSILDMDRPTDRELEAKIIHLIRKYENMQNEDGNRLSNFFKQVYDHFLTTMKRMKRSKVLIQIILYKTIPIYLLYKPNK